VTATLSLELLQGHVVFFVGHREALRNLAREEVRLGHIHGDAGFGVAGALDLVQAALEGFLSRAHRVFEKPGIILVFVLICKISRLFVSLITANLLNVSLFDIHFSPLTILLTAFRRPEHNLLIHVLTRLDAGRPAAPHNYARIASLQLDRASSQAPSVVPLTHQYSHTAHT